MKSVFKFRLPYTDSQLLGIWMPINAEPLHVAMQNGVPVLWMLCDPDEKQGEERMFRMVGTGHPSVTPGSTYMGTVQDGMFVWHFFEETA